MLVTKAYRALIVACGRCGTDRRTELMKLYGLMRTDSIFPNAVTLGQYTRAIAEGFSKRSMDPSGDSQSKVGMHVIVSSDGKEEVNQFNLGALDVNLSLLEESGLRWRSTEQAKEDTANGKQKEKRSLLQAKTFDTATTQRNYKTKRAWLPVTCSSSFCFAHSNYSGGKTSTKTDNVCLFALWSRVSGCDSCAYTPLDEEIQCGWDVVHDSLEMPSYITCPRCGSKILPQIGYKEMSIKEALGPEKTHIKYDDDVNISAETANNAMNIPVDRLPSLEVSMVEASDASLYDMPPQLETTIHYKNSPACLNEQGRSGSVTYVSPMKLRSMLEQLVLEFGEEVIDRDRLKALDPQIFFNLWWYSARFSLPLPLSTASSYNSNVKSDESDHTDSHDYCAFASWDKSVALQGCRSAAKAIMAAQALPSTSDRHVREKLFDNPNTDMPLLAFFNLQSYSQGDWDHADLSEILVALVKSCDSRDLFPVVECVFKRNSIRQEEKEERDDHAMALARRSMSRTGGNNALNTSFESAGTVSFSVGASTDASFCQSSTDLDCYRTLLYLTRYQCTTAFHAFFPTTVKACKGYHFWCAQGTPLPIFDRAFREAAEEYNKKSKRIVPIPDVSDVALGFRCVFGHVI